jgi:hypothetical protein
MIGKTLAHYEIDRSFGLFPASKDPGIHTYRLFDRAIIELQAGRLDASVATLTELAGRQSDVFSPAILRDSPLFDALRGHDGFQRLIAERS